MRAPISQACLAAAVIAGFCFAQEANLDVQVLDGTGAVVGGAAVKARRIGAGWEKTEFTTDRGTASFANLPRGEYEVVVEARGFAPSRLQLSWPSSGNLTVDLRPADLAEQVRVTANRIAGTPEQLERLPGSAYLLQAADLEQARVLTTEEALRKVPGVHARGEDGFGLRPNIGIRGLNPTRSSRVLLLEDGVPLSYAPYGDNASYYHPPVDRFEGVEIVKGGGQILYGPMTVGGVVNYLTPAPPSDRGGSLTLTGGNRDYFNGHFRYGGTWKGTGMLFDALRKQGEGLRDNTRHGVTDLSAKTLTPIGAAQTLSLKFNRYSEDSQLTYSGLRQSEWDLNPRANPFVHDQFDISRYGGSATHLWTPRSNMTVRNTGYATFFDRDWWRQSSNSNQRPNDSADPRCGGMANLLTTCGNEGRLRHYYTWGLENATRVSHRLLGASNLTDFGFRAHFEDQERVQQNGDTPQARSGAVVENNQRLAKTFSTFVQNQFVWNKLVVTPGARLEYIRYSRWNRLNNARGSETLVKVIPGLGIAYNANEKLTVFAGVHRGFAPPRVEDVISNSTGQSIELAPELSWNYEVGFRARVQRTLSLEATAFRMDFSNQVVPASVAGGIGSNLTNAGRTLHQGAEAAGRWDWRNVFQSRSSFSLRAAYTWVPVSRFQGARLSSVPGFTRVPVSGNRLPYSPENLLTASASYSHASGLNAMFETVYTGRQFGDDLNTMGGTPDGQRGALPGNALFNASLNYPVEALRSTFFITAKNLTNRTVIVDRSRGLLPGIPRLVQAGLQFTF